MCGIAFATQATTEQIDDAAARLRRRGPDDSYTITRPDFALAVTRLSIVDTTRSLRGLVEGNDSNISVAFNGEIWNRSELITKYAQSVPDLAECDLIRLLYRRFGWKLLDLLDGMYAFVIVDCERRTVVAARDHCGVKPLYYSLQDGIRIASDVSALIALGQPVALNPRFVINHSVLGFSDYSDCAIKGVHQIPPGHALDTRPGIEPTLHRSAPEAYTPTTGSFPDAFRQSVRAAVTHHCDSRLGVLLSGGIDSSLLLATALEYCDPQNLVAINLAGGSIHDRFFASQVADELGVEMVTVPLDEGTFRRYFDSAPANMSGYPFVSLPISFCAIRSLLPDLRILICGEGAAELFVG